MTGQAFGPWIWKRQYARVTALPYGRAGERSSSSKSSVVAAGLGVVREPVGDRGTADVHELLVVEMEEDAVADHVAGRRRRHVLLGHVDREVRDAVDGRVGDQLEGIRALEEEVDHVVGLVEEHGASRARRAARGASC